LQERISRLTGNAEPVKVDLEKWK